jgi:hypothetical protein
MRDLSPRETTRQLFDLEGAYKLDADRRVARKYARVEHMREAIAYRLECAGADDAWLQEMRAELHFLAPFWGPGAPKEQAVLYFVAAVRGADNRGTVGAPHQGGR